MSVSSIPRGLADGFQDVGRLRQDGFLEIGAVGDRNVLRADAPHRRVEVLEQFAGDARARSPRRSRTSADPRAR